MKANGDRFEKAIDACIKNGRRLLEDSEYMKDYDRLPTAKALAILAQEEFRESIYTQACPRRSDTMV